MQKTSTTNVINCFKILEVEELEDKTHSTRFVRDHNKLLIKDDNYELIKIPSHYV